MTGQSRSVPGPRAMIIAALIVGVVLLAFWAGYQVGKDIALTENKQDSHGSTLAGEGLPG